jgi:TM2 domain-containing membrane protein YozV
MNCANHPDTPVAAYCQNCGKALCTNCVRSVAGVIYCEQCLAARLGIGAAPGPAAGAQTYLPGVVAPGGPNPGTAFVLGFIPGVGAMYNGQFVKGMIHVLIFVILVAMANHEGVFGILVAAWVVYQVFDSYQTAKARREGMPLPDPFGLNELGVKMGIQMGGTPAHGFTATQVPPMPPPPPGAGYPPPAGFTGSPYSPYSNVPPVPPPPGVVPPGAVPPPGFDPTMIPPRRREPIGALILIGLGVLFLLNTLDVFHFNWIGHLWPLLIIAIGAGLLIRRTREVQPPPPPPPPSSGGSQ